MVDVDAPPFRVRMWYPQKAEVSAQLVYAIHCSIIYDNLCLLSWI